MNNKWTCHIKVCVSVVIKAEPEGDGAGGVTKNDSPMTIMPHLIS